MKGGESMKLFRWKSIEEMELEFLRRSRTQLNAVFLIALIYFGSAILVGSLSLWLAHEVDQQETQEWVDGQNAAMGLD